VKEQFGQNKMVVLLNPLTPLLQTRWINLLGKFYGIGKKCYITQLKKIKKNMIKNMVKNKKWIVE
jgi:hypothetical protein